MYISELWLSSFQFCLASFSELLQHNDKRAAGCLRWWTAALQQLLQTIEGLKALLFMLGIIYQCLLQEKNWYLCIYLKATIINSSRVYINSIFYENLLHFSKKFSERNSTVTNIFNTQLNWTQLDMISTSFILLICVILVEVYKENSQRCKVGKWRATLIFFQVVMDTFL